MPSTRALSDPERISLALAGAAYEAGTVRLASRDLGGYSHIAASRQGLFAIREGGSSLIAHGLFFGVTLAGPSIYVFEACDLPRFATGRGRIIRLIREGGRIVKTEVIASGLNNGCHQIDIIDGRLCVLDTYGQRVLRFGLDGTLNDILQPLPPAPRDDWTGGYVHFNSLLAVDGRILLLLHNGGEATGRQSELAVLDRDWRLTDRHTLPGLGCHNIAVLEDGALLSCASLSGELIGPGGRRVKISPMMTRGLSVDSDMIVVGASTFSGRRTRHRAAGTVTFLDRAFRVRSVLDLPGAPTEIRKLDGDDYSLSPGAAGHVAIAFADIVMPARGAPLNP